MTPDTVGQKSIQINPNQTTEPDGSQTGDDDDFNEGAGMSKVKHFIAGFEEMIQFMDFSFERAFQQKDNEFMIAYRDHIKEIQLELDQLKRDSNDDKYIEKKREKIESLEGKLSQIRKQALFLGDMSEMHCKAIKEKKLLVDE